MLTEDGLFLALDISIIRRNAKSLDPFKCEPKGDLNSISRQKTFGKRFSKCDMVMLRHILLLKTDPPSGTCGNYQVCWKGPRAGSQWWRIRTSLSAPDPMLEYIMSKLLKRSILNISYPRSLVHQTTHRRLLSPP